MLSVNQERALIALGAFGAGLVVGSLTYHLILKYRKATLVEEVETDTVYVVEDDDDDDDEDDVGVINPTDSTKDMETSSEQPVTEEELEKRKSFLRNNIFEKPPIEEWEERAMEYLPWPDEIEDYETAEEDHMIDPTFLDRYREFINKGTSGHQCRVINSIQYYNTREIHELHYFPQDDIWAGFDDELEELSEEELEGSIHKFAARALREYCKDCELPENDFVPYGILFMLNEDSAIAYKIIIEEGEYIDAYVAWDEK